MDEIGRTKEWIDLRERLKRQGMEPVDAWREAGETILEQHEQGGFHDEVTQTCPPQLSDESHLSDDASEADQPECSTVNAEADDSKSVKEWDRLARAAQDREAEPHTNIKWVFNHLDRDIASIPDDGPPSPGAVSILRMTHEIAEFKRKFIEQMYPKTLPSKASVDQDKSNRESEAAVLSLIKACEEARRASLAKAAKERSRETSCRHEWSHDSGREVATCLHCGDQINDSDRAALAHPTAA